MEPLQSSEKAGEALQSLSRHERRKEARVVHATLQPGVWQNIHGRQQWNARPPREDGVAGAGLERFEHRHGARLSRMLRWRHSARGEVDAIAADDAGRQTTRPQELEQQQGSSGGALRQLARWREGTATREVEATSSVEWRSSLRFRNAIACDADRAVRALRWTLGQRRSRAPLIPPPTPIHVSRTGEGKGEASPSSSPLFLSYLRLPHASYTWVGSNRGRYALEIYRPVGCVGGRCCCWRPRLLPSLTAPSRTRPRRPCRCRCTC